MFTKRSRDEMCERLIALRNESPEEFEALSYGVRRTVEGYEQERALKAPLAVTQPDLLRQKAQQFADSEASRRDDRMEALLRQRSEAPAEFDRLPAQLKDELQIYEDLRAPYTEALAAGLITERTV